MTSRRSASDAGDERLPRSEKPVVGTFGAAPQDEEADGVVLYDPDSWLDTSFDNEVPAYTQPKRSYAWVLPVLAVVAVAAAYVLVEGLPGAPVTPDAQAELPPLVPSMIEGADAPEALRPAREGPVTGQVGESVQVAVRANAVGGVPLPDTLVLFGIESGDGTLGTAEVRTDVEGRAATSVLLPLRPGTTIVTAAVSGSSIPEARIAVRALPGAPAQMSVLAGSGQAGEVGELLPVRPSVRIVDAADNPVPGVPVNFVVRSGDGLLAPTQTRTDSLGRASALWRLGVVEGTQTVAATSPLMATEALFSATARPQAAIPTPAGRSTGIDPGPLTIRRTTFVVGGSHVCRLEDGTTRCRGSNTRGEGSTDATSRFVSLASGIQHVCGLDATGTAYCWGANTGGQLGDGTRTDRPSPVPVRTELKFSMLTAGRDHTCGLAGGGVPLCWGANLNGQLGDGSRTDQRAPRTVGGGISFSSLTAGWDHTCGLTSNGNAFCWGANTRGQLGDGSRLDRLVPTLVRGSVTSLVAGSEHTCGISERRALCWGANGSGQLGDGTTEDRSQPTAVTGLPSSPTMLAAGAVHTCALVSGGRAFCWGANQSGQLGDGTTQTHAAPVEVGGGLTFSEIHAGGALTCGVTTDGDEYCWGLNQAGQIGDGTRVNRPGPTRVSG